MDRVHDASGVDFPATFEVGPADTTENYELARNLLILHFAEPLRTGGDNDDVFDEDSIKSVMEDQLQLDAAALALHDQLLAGKLIDDFGKQGLRAAGMRIIPADPNMNLLDQIEDHVQRGAGALKAVTPLYLRVGWEFEKAATPLVHEIMAVMAESVIRTQGIAAFEEIYDGMGMEVAEGFDGPGFERVLIARAEGDLALLPRTAFALYEELRQSPAFEDVEPGWMRLFPYAEVGPPNPPNLDDLDYLEMIKAINVWNLPSPVTGAGVRVGIVDDGFDAHPDLSIADGRNFDLSGLMPGSSEWGKHDGSGHGTMVAGLIGARLSAGAGGDVVGVAPGCDLVVARIGPGVDHLEVAEAIRWLAIQPDVGVINLSLNTVASSGVAWAISAAVNNHDVVVCAAAGNAGASYCKLAGVTLCPQGLDFPASLQDTLAVGAIATTWGERKNCGTPDQEEWQSQWGSFSLDVVAPGVGLWTTDELGPSGLTVQGEPRAPRAGPLKVSGTSDGDYYALAGATSGATALVSGLAALVRSTTSATTGTKPSAARTMDIIRSTCEKVMDQTHANNLNLEKWYEYRSMDGSPWTKSSATGYGLIDCLAAVTEAQK